MKKVTQPKQHFYLLAYLPYGICFLFFLCYSVLSVIRHLHFGSFGFDLGIADQIIWEYSRFHAPITTIDHIPFISELFVHVEFIYLLIAPFYWIYNNVITLILLQAFVVSSSALPIFLLAKEHTVEKTISYILLISYLAFYGIQNALWFDAHSAAFGTSFLTWFIYFLDKKQIKLSLVFFFLTILCKENFAAMTLLVSFVYFYRTKEKKYLIFTLLSVMYLAIIFGYYFAHVVPGGYRFESKDGLIGDDASLMDLGNTDEKRQVLFYTFAWTGFLSLLQPLFLLPLLGNLASYFILGRDVSTAQGLFLQYRIELDPLLFWATIYSITTYSWLNTRKTALYLVICAILLQYMLHLPLSYLTKQWFWQEPKSVHDINYILNYLPTNASVVAQNNIIPHISHRYDIYTLWPTQKSFPTDSPCGKLNCEWFTWAGNPRYLVVDSAKDWDIRHLLANREEYKQGLQDLEKKGYIVPVKRSGEAVLYKIVKKAD